RRSTPRARDRLSAQAPPGAPTGRPTRPAGLEPPAALLRARTSVAKYRGWHASVCGEVVKQDERGPFDEALRRAREAAYDPGEYVEQESFMRAGEIRTLAERAGITREVSVLDLCCGVAGLALSLTRELGCSYLGVDASVSAVEIARARA